MRSPEAIDLVVLVGPTAVGKSRTALELARRWGGEVVSGDSMQVYRYMSIGTAKPTIQERALVRHHLVDVRFPDEDFSVAAYQRLAREAIAAVAARGRPPLLVGGSGLYIQAAIDGYSFVDLETDWALRARLLDEARARGEAGLHRWLAEVDPVTAARVHPHDLRRTVRAMEVYLRTGQPLSGLQPQPGPGPYRPVMIGLSLPRAALNARIDARVHDMARAGLRAEVESLLGRGYAESLRSMQALGYKETAAHLLGRATWEETVSRIRRGTRALAKRQVTWFGRDRRIHWLDAGEGVAALVERIEKFLGGKWIEG